MHKLSLFIQPKQLHHWLHLAYQFATRVFQSSVIRFKKISYWLGVMAAGSIVAMVIATIGGVPIFGDVAHAGASEILSWSVASLMYLFAALLLGLAIVFAYILEIVILYPYGDPSWTSAWNGGGFINVPAVITGWKLIRDICNIFFSLIFIVIALANVLKIEAYSWKTLLPKFFLMAILINFSRTICGVFTDFATVVTATFGSAFPGSFMRGVIGMVGLPVATDLFTPPTSQPAPEATNSVILAAATLVVMALAFCVIIVVLTVTIIFSIIMIWFLVVIAPLAYLTRILPSTSKYSGQWWEMFGRYVIVRPLVVFFLWLALTMAFGNSSTSDTSTALNVFFQPAVAASNTASSIKSQSATPLTGIVSNAMNSSTGATGLSTAPQNQFKATQPDFMANFVVSILMLMAGLKFTSQMAAEFGQYIGQAEAFAWSAGKSALRKPGQFLARFGTNMGKPPEYNDDGSLKAGTGGAGYAIGRTMAFLGTTLGQPVEYIQTALKNFESVGEGRQATARAQVMSMNAEWRQRGIRGRGLAGGVSGALANLAGVIGGAGMDDGDTIFDNYISGQGVVRLLKKGRHMVNGDAATMDRLQTEIQALDGEIARLNDLMTQEEAPEALQRYDALHSQATNLRNSLRDLVRSGDTDLDLRDQNIQNLVQMQIQNLEDRRTQLNNSGLHSQASKVGEQIAALQRIKNNPETRKKKESQIASQNQLIADMAARRAVETDPARQADLDTQITNANARLAQLITERDAASQSVKVSELQDAVVGTGIFDSQLEANLRSGIARDARDLVKNMYSEASRARINVERRMQRSGFQFDRNGLILNRAVDAATAATAGETRTYATNKQRSDLVERKRVANGHLNRLQAIFSALNGDDGYSTHQQEQKGISEALGKLSNIYQPQQLAERIEGALLNGDQNTAIAAFLRAQQMGSLDDLLAYFAVDENGRVDENVGTHPKGINHVLDKVLRKGLRTSEVSRRDLINRLSVDAWGQRNYDRAMMVGWRGGNWTLNFNSDPAAPAGNDFRDQLISLLTSRMNPREFLSSSSRFTFGHVNSQGNFEIADPNSAIGKALVNFSATMADQYFFQSMSPYIRAELSRPENIAKLRTAGAHPGAIANLTNFWYEQGRYIVRGAARPSAGRTRFESGLRS